MNTIDLVNINNKLKPELYPKNHDKIEFFSIQDYHDLARSSIIDFASRFLPSYMIHRMLHSDDIISNIATDIMFGHWKYDGRGVQEAYLIMCAKYSIAKYIVRNKHSSKHPTVSYSNNTKLLNHILIDDITPDQASIKTEESDILHTMLEDASLNHDEIECLTMHYFDGLNKAEIGRRKTLCRERIRQILDIAINKLKQEVST